MNAPWLVLFPLLPALAGVGLLLARRRAERWAGRVAVVAGLACVIASLTLWWAPAGLRLPWLPLAGGVLQLGLSARAPVPALLTGIATISLLVFAHTHERPRRAGAARLFGFLLLFLAGMLWLTLADDLLTLLLGWELVAAASYALIGFRYHSRDALNGAAQAFLSGRVTDLGLYLALFAALASGPDTSFATLPTLPAREFIAGGLIVAALGKSAQWPFHGWLTGAMRGPSAVSALLHSTLLLAAGVVLMMKAYPLLIAVPWALPLLMGVGVASALAGGLIALYQDRLKALLAASTISAFGYLYAGLAAGALAATTAHLFGHAAFKALLFLQVGLSLGAGERPERGQTLPLAVGLLALAGLPPTGAFVSRDALIAGIGTADALAGTVLLILCFVTGAYGARAWRLFRAFPVGPFANPPAADWLLAALTVALALLALSPWGELWAAAFPAPFHPHISSGTTIAALLLTLLGGAWGMRLSLRRRRDALITLSAAWLGGPALLTAIRRGVLALAAAAARLDRLDPVGALAGRVPRAAGVVARFDAAVIGRLTVAAPRRAALALAEAAARLERTAPDRAPALLGRVLSAASRGLARLHDGRLFHYFALTLGGVGVLLVVALTN